MISTRVFLFIGLGLAVACSCQAANLATKISKVSISDVVADNLRQSLIRLPGHQSTEQRQPDDPEFAPQERCSLNITDLIPRSSGTINSPKYPQNYIPDGACQWNLESEPGTVIEATFFDFVTQPWAFFYFDYVMVSDTGDWDDYYYKFSGNLNKVLPYTIKTKSNRLSIRFVSSYLINFRGFKLSYVVRPENTNNLTETDALTATCAHDPLPLPKAADSMTRPSFAQDGLWSTAGKGQFERGNSAQKIAAANEVTPHEYPFVVALLVDDMYFCGGSLIDNQHVLTAAHCIHGGENVQVFMGSHDLTMEESTRVHQTVENSNFTQFFTHPDYDVATGANDIAIIRLNNKVEYTAFIQPVYLPSPESMANNFENYNVTTAGWGEWTKQTEAPRISATLRRTSSTVIPNRICQDSFHDLVTGNVLCAVGYRADSPCNGDSGSPLVAPFNPSPSVNETNTDVCYNGGNRMRDVTGGKPWYVQLGVLSFGTRTCGSSAPVAYTRITAYLDFITSILETA